jgi:hypothetical protein
MTADKGGGSVGDFQGVTATQFVLQNETFSADYGTPITLTQAQLLAGDTDPQGGTLSVTGVSGSGATLSAAGTVTFTPPAQQTPGNIASFTYTVADTAGLSGTATADINLISLPPLTITGAVADQKTSDEVPVKPFVGVTVTDPNAGSPTETVTVTPSTTANGTLSDPNAASDGSTLSNGVYTVTGSASAVTTALDGLVFTPTADETAPGQSVTTGFTISDTNSAQQTTTNSTTSVVATALNDPPILNKPVLSYTVAEGQTLQGLYAQLLANAGDSDAGDQAQITLSSVGSSNTVGFLYFDPTAKMLTYTASGYNAQSPTDSFTYTLTTPQDGTVTGTVDIAVTGPSLPTQVGTAGNTTLTANGADQRLIGGPNDSLTAQGSGSLLFGGHGTDTLTADGANSTVYSGTGSKTVTLNGAPQTVALQQGALDQISGFNLYNDVLDLTQVLAESQINLGGNIGNLGSYFTVSSAGSDATLSFNPEGAGAGTALAVLHGVGPGVTLATLIGDHTLTI